MKLGGVEDFGFNLAKFLQEEGDLQQIWDTIDENGNHIFFGANDSN